LAAKYPYLDGNVLIVPKRHIEQLERITAEEWADLHGVIIHSKKILKGLFDAGGFNMAINIGKESGASIKHLHWQLLPRKKGQRQASLNIIADLQLISVSGDDLKEMIEKGGRG
jgi:ATP adenylyltransferase